MQYKYDLWLFLEFWLKIMPNSYDIFQKVHNPFFPISMGHRKSLVGLEEGHSPYSCIHILTHLLENCSILSTGVGLFISHAAQSCLKCIWLHVIPKSDMLRDLWNASLPLFVYLTSLFSMRPAHIVFFFGGGVLFIILLETDQAGSTIVRQQ